MCTTSVSSYLFSSVCFKWHMCIVKRHTYLWGADKQPNTNTGFFLQGRSIVVILNTTRGTWHWKAHYMRMTRDNGLFRCECLSLAISSLPLNLKWGTGRRPGYMGLRETCANCVLILIQLLVLGSICSRTLTVNLVSDFLGVIFNDQLCVYIYIKKQKTTTNNS